MNNESIVEKQAENLERSNTPQVEENQSKIVILTNTPLSSQTHDFENFEFHENLNDILISPTTFWIPSPDGGNMSIATQHWIESGAGSHSFPTLSDISPTCVKRSIGMMKLNLTPESQVRETSQPIRYYPLRYCDASLIFRTKIAKRV
jgi:hypothetical protein